MKPIDRAYNALYHEEPDAVPDDNDLSSVANIVEMETLKAGPGFRILRSPFGSVEFTTLTSRLGTVL